MAKYWIASIVLVVFLMTPSLANTALDTDHDAVPDKDETNIYKTDPLKADTDGDGFNDGVELRAGYSPLNPLKVKLEDNDFDHDGLSDRMELKFGTDLARADTDGDGDNDGREINLGYDPLKAGDARLEKKIKINLEKQELEYFISNVRLDTFKVSTGKRSMPTPRGEFKILNKSKKAWSRTYGLWMPYWLGLGNFGIHELPIWPNGYREGANHLGIPVSHGCIRLGIGPAKTLYDWAEVGTKVIIE
jgi:hypothetical protein